MRLSIATKIFIAFACIVALFAGVMTTGLLQSQRQYTQIHTLNRSIVPLSLLISDAQNDLRSFDSALSEQDPDLLKRTLRVAQIMSFVPKRFGGKLKQSALLSHPLRIAGLDEANRLRMKGIHKRIKFTSAASDELNETTKKLLHVLKDETTSEQTQKTITKLQQEARQQTRTLDAELSKIKNDVRVLMDLSLIKTSENERSNTYALAIMSAIALLFSLALLGVVLLMVRPIKLLTDGAKRVAQGNYTPLDIEHYAILGKDEIATLTQEFNSMAQALRIRDTALKTQHDVLLKSERLATIGRMTSVVTHELRNPLSSIGLNAEMLSETILETELDQEIRQDMLDHLELIVMEVDRLRDITEEYLVYARLPSPKFAPHDMADLLEQFIDFHQLEWRSHDIRLNMLTRPLIAHIDANQIRQAMLNLIKNAVEASPSGGPCQVDITLDCQKNTVRLLIRDYGVGIDKATKDRLFEPFFTSKPQGTGLGLAMTLQIVESHQGTITIEDPEHGSGTIFSISFPQKSDRVIQEQS